MNRLGKTPDYVDVKTWLAILLGSTASMAVLWLTLIPLGVSGEWTWERAAVEPDTFWNLSGGGVAAALLIGFVWLGMQRFERFKSSSLPVAETTFWLIGLAAISFAWIWIVQEIAPVKNRLGKSAFVLYYQNSSGYFTRARFIEPKAATLLMGYEDLMRQGDVLHTGTHPPGLFLVFHGLIGLCDGSRQLSLFLDATTPASFREACDVIATNSIRGGAPRPLLPLDRRVLWLATLLVMISASLAVVPLFFLLCRHYSVVEAWAFAAVWPAMPAIAIFVPKSDVVFPLIGLLLLWIWLTAWDFRSVFLAVLAGFVTWCGLMCSLAFLPVVLAAAIATLGASVLKQAFPSTIHRLTGSQVNSLFKLDLLRCACVFAAGFGFAIPTIALWFFARLNMLNVWLLNYRNHAGFYSQYPRTYWKWLLVNPMELSFAAGWPLTLLASFAGMSLLYHLWRRSESVLKPGMAIEIGSFVFVWGLLWLTGKNSGEAARLWIIFFPWIICAAYAQVASTGLGNSKFEFRPTHLCMLLAIQFIVCLFTVARAHGFHFDAS